MSKPTSNLVIKSSATEMETSSTALLPADVLSHVLLFTDLKDISSISCVCQEWHAVLKGAEQEVWECIMKKHYPRLTKIIQMAPSTTNTASSAFSWKEAFKTHVTSSAWGLNKDLQKDFETVFRPRGVVAYTNCCHYGCSGSYNDDPAFVKRTDDGIYFIRFSLNGMNYEPYYWGIVPAHYGSIEYLNKNWEQECLLLDQWCAVLGLKKGDYVIQKPESENICVIIELKKAVTLDSEEEEGSSEEGISTEIIESDE